MSMREFFMSDYLALYIVLSFLSLIPIAWLIARSIERLCNRLDWHRFEKTIKHKYDARLLADIKASYRKDWPF